MQRLIILLSFLFAIGFAVDAFACSNGMSRWKTDPVVHNNTLVAWHLSRGENREALQKVAFRYRRAAVEQWAMQIAAGEEFSNAKRKRVVHLTAAAVVRSEGMWARTDEAEPLGELEARANLEWAVTVLKVLARDSIEAQAYLIEGRYRLDGDGMAAARSLTALAASDQLPDGVSWRLLAQLTTDKHDATRAEKKSETLLASAQQLERPKNSREWVASSYKGPPRRVRKPDYVLDLF